MLQQVEATTIIFQHHQDSAQVDAGIDKDLVFGDSKAPRFVFWDGRLRPTPSGPDVLTFDLLSLWGKLRAGLGAAGLKAKKPGTPQLYHVLDR